MRFTYNLSDTQHFPNASAKGGTSVVIPHLEGQVEDWPFQEPHEGLLGLPAFLSPDFLFLFCPFLLDAGQSLSMFSLVLQAFSLPSVADCMLVCC